MSDSCTSMCNAFRFQKGGKTRFISRAYWKALQQTNKTQQQRQRTNRQMGVRDRYNQIEREFLMLRTKNSVHGLARWSNQTISPFFVISFQRVSDFYWLQTFPSGQFLIRPSVVNTQSNTCQTSGIIYNISFYYM